MTVALRDATIYTGEAFVEGHALLIRDGAVADILCNSNIPARAEAISYAGKILAPGFIDAQVNGGGNVMFNNTPTAEACLAIAKSHRRYGTTRLLPTCITDSPDTTRRAIAAMREARRGDRGILGIHIEGPHLGAARRGVHKAEYLRAMSSADVQLYTPRDGEVMLITLAPECVEQKQIEHLCARGVIVSIGHTQATSDQVRGALGAGATCFTHLFNGMGGLSARSNGPADVALDDRTSWCGLIADGHHVSAAMIRLALRAKPERIFLVSDAMPPSASDDPRPFQLYGETICPLDGRCVNGEGKLAGAVLTLAEAVHNCVAEFAIEPGEALRMASTIPAALLGLDRMYGKLLPGFTADVVVLNTDMTVAESWSAGTRYGA